MSSSSLPRLAELRHTAVLTVGGSDATEFLHAQLSCDLRTLPEHTFALGAWHSPSGKVKALVRLLRTESVWRLTTTRESASKTVADLSRFVLRDDVDLHDSSDHWGVSAVIGESSKWLATEGIPLGRESGQTATSGELNWLRIGPELVHVLGPLEALTALSTRLPRTTEDSAVAAEISLGLPSLPGDLSERFVPQMLNLDLLGALNAGKGCYPGQEVIARTQNLGSVKRRAQRFSLPCEGSVDPGSHIVDDHGEVVGDVLRAATTEKGIELLAVVRLTSIESALHLETGPQLTLRHESLPYSDRVNPVPPASGAETE